MSPDERLLVFQANRDSNAIGEQDLHVAERTLTRQVFFFILKEDRLSRGRAGAMGRDHAAIE